MSLRTAAAFPGGEAIQVMEWTVLSLRSSQQQFLKGAFFATEELALSLPKGLAWPG